jgi:hypothetical protein
VSVYGVTAGNCAVDSVTHFNPLNHRRYSIFGQGSRVKYDLSVAGGTDALRYFVAGGLSNETGITRMPDVFRPKAQALGLPSSATRPNGEDQRSVRANTAIRLGPSADLSVTGAYLSTYQQTPSAYRLTFGPIGGPVLPDSAHYYGYGYSIGSPIEQFGLVQSEQTDRLTGGMTANWRPAQWLVAHGTVGLDHGARRDHGLNLPQSYFGTFGLPNQGATWLREATTDIYSTDLRASATATLAPVVRAVTSVGLQLVDTRIQGLSAAANGLSSTNLTLNGATNPQLAQTGDRQATLGGYGEEQVSLADRVFLTGALRVDAASGFGRSYNTAAYPKASVSWVVLSQPSATVRVRGAYGQSGVQPHNGAALQLYSSQAEWLNGGPVSVYRLSAPGNPALQPERSAEFEGGVDVGLWASRLSLELTGYSKTTHNALVDVTPGWNVGNFTYEENVGEVRNTGVEGAVNATLIQARPLTWDLSLNASINHNKLISLAPGLSKQGVGLGGLPFGPVQAVGYPLFGNWGMGVRYADLNHDGVLESDEVLSADSASFLGSSVPTREASLATHVGLGGGALAVGALLDYRGGFRVANQNAAYGASNSSTLREQNLPGSPLWLQARAIADITTSCCVFGFPNGFFEDGTYLRFRELSLTYVVPGRWSRAVRVRTVSLTGAVRNLALWTRYTGPDPEANNGFGANNQHLFNSNQSVTNNNVRADLSTVPLARYWVLRLNVGL